MKWKVNDGKYIVFWHGVWNYEIPLKIKVPRFFALSMIKNGTIVDA